MLLTLLLLVPLVGTLVVLALPKERPDLIRGVSLAFGLGGFLFAFPLWFTFERGVTGYQWVAERAWIPSIGASWRVGLDGIALLLILLTLLLLPLVQLFSWKSVHERLKEYHACLLVLQVGMLGVFVSLDVLQFFVFWEVMLVPMYLLIGVWGGGTLR